jgi:hypothetical protein
MAFAGLAMATVNALLFVEETGTPKRSSLLEDIIQPNFRLH